MINKIFTKSLLVFVFFIAFQQGIHAQVNDGDWLLFPESIYTCFYPGQCQYGEVDFYGSIENDSCNQIDYSIDYSFAESWNPTVILLQKLNIKSTQINIELWEGSFFVYTHGTAACGAEAYDTTMFILETCGPPFAVASFNEAKLVSASEGVTISAVRDIYDHQFSNCLEVGGYIDTLRFKIDDGLITPTNLVDSLQFTIADTGYHLIQLWEHSWGEWHYSGSTWNHIYTAYDNTISGTVYYDQNDNCFFDDGERGIEGRTVYSGGFNISDTSDSLGQYSLTYRVPPTPTYIENTGLIHLFATGCQTDTIFPHALLDQGSIHMDWGVQLKPDCSELQVDIAAPFLRRCFNAQYYVSYYNAGTETVDSAYIEIEFDPFLEVVSSTIPWSSVDGQKYTFPIGEVTGGAGESFEVLVYTDCDNTVLGQSHCTEAHIYPDETCQDTMGLWSGGNIELKALCASDSVRFSIKNTGLSPTTIPLDYYIVEDDIIIFFQTFDPLNPGDSILIGLPKTGGSYFAQSEQEPFHPFPGNPSAFIEGCTSGTDSISIGYAGQFPINDEEPFLDIDCIENIGSFDPNDKAGFPRGYSAEHFVEPGDKLEYTIRFQNTGTDTAFTVRVIDTLSAHFLFGTFHPTISSHAYEYNITPEGIATFTFNQIALPDSNVNEMNSHGFIKFKIQLRKDLTAGTIINNAAAIYFDFNEPVITNLVDHRIEPDFVKTIFESTPIQPQPQQQINEWVALIMPNPASTFGFIQVDHPFLPKNVDVSIINSMGQLVTTLTTSPDGRSAINMPMLSNGLYFARIEYQGHIVKYARFVKN